MNPASDREGEKQSPECLHLSNRRSRLDFRSKNNEMTSEVMLPESPPAAWSGLEKHHGLV